MSRQYGGAFSNVDSVIEDVGDVEDDLRHEMHKRVGSAMRMVEKRAKQYVMQDSNHRGGLVDSIRRSTHSTDKTIKFTVSAHAPHAAIVEYGSGERTNQPWEKSKVPPPMDLSTPRGFPYSAPDMDYNEDNPFDLTGKNSFAGFVGHIEEWMATKPVESRINDRFASAVIIAQTIVEEGNLAHPFMRPAWFDKRLRVEKAAKDAVKNATR